MQKTWEERLRETEALADSSQEALRALGIIGAVDKTAMMEKAKTVPHILNLNEDPMLDRQIMYFFDEGRVTKIGRRDAAEVQDISLGGLSIQQQHATVENVEGVCTLRALAGAKTSVNGDQVVDTFRLSNRDRIVFGNNQVFLMVHPGEALMGEGKDSKEELPEVIDHQFAVMELNKSQVQAMAQQEAKRRAEAETAAREAQAKVKEIEERMETQKRKAQEDAEARLRYFEEKEKELQAQAEAIRVNAQAGNVGSAEVESRLRVCGWHW